MSSAKVNVWLQIESWVYIVDVYEKQCRIKKGTLTNSSVCVGVTALISDLIFTLFPMNMV
jgi:hypothetical protein